MQWLYNKLNGTYTNYVHILNSLVKKIFVYHQWFNFSLLYLFFVTKFSILIMKENGCLVKKNASLGSRRIPR